MIFKLWIEFSNNIFIETMDGSLTFSIRALFQTLNGNKIFQKLDALESVHAIVVQLVKYRLLALLDQGLRHETTLPQKVQVNLGLSEGLERTGPALVLRLHSLTSRSSRQSLWDRRLWISCCCCFFRRKDFCYVRITSWPRSLVNFLSTIYCSAVTPQSTIFAWLDLASNNPVQRRSRLGPQWNDPWVSRPRLRSPCRSAVGAAQVWSRSRSSVRLRNRSWSWFWAFESSFSKHWLNNNYWHADSRGWNVTIQTFA